MIYFHLLFLLCLIHFCNCQVPCTYNGTDGVCIDESLCNVGVSIASVFGASGCNRLASNIKCCVVLPCSNGTTTNAATGTCLLLSANCTTSRRERSSDCDRTFASVLFSSSCCIGLQPPSTTTASATTTIVAQTPAPTPSSFCRFSSSPRYSITGQCIDNSTQLCGGISLLDAKSFNNTITNNCPLNVRKYFISLAL